MKFSRFGIVFFLFVGIIVFSCGLLISLKNKSKLPSNVISPFPAAFDPRGPEVLAASTYWRPASETVYQWSIPQPDLTAISGLSYDLTTNRMLYAKDIHVRHPIASITKIMTAIIAIETEPLDQKITISRSAATIGNNEMGLSEGEKLTVNDLLYGLILPSGNDAAESLAQGSKFGRDNFVYLMNQKAEDLGLSDTHFTNPSGLEGDGNQYSTAYDLLVMTRYGLRNPTFAKIVATVNYEIPATIDHKEYQLFNETNLLTSYPGVEGVKIGYTNEAGMCLVTYLNYQGHKIISVLLNSDDRRGEMKELLDYSLRAEGVAPPPHQ